MDYSNDANERNANNKRKKRRKKKNTVGVIILRILFILIIIGAFAVVGAVLGAYMGIIESAPSLNTADVVPESYTSIIYDASGNEIDRLHGEENREYVTLDQIPLNLRNAVVAIEDERFYDHNGIDIRGMLRALVTNIKSGEATQGASTITQQLIKNNVLDSEKKLKRKLQEQYLAVTFEKQLTDKLGSKQAAKNYILELYLNTIGLNHGLNGVGSAAKFYFGKSVNELTLAECASLAGITKNPSRYSPVSRPDENKERQMLVLDKMKELGFITETQYTEAKYEDIYSKIVGQLNTDYESGSIHNYFVDALIESLASDLREQRGMSRQQALNLIYSGGLKINTTVDMPMQSILEESYKDDSLFPPEPSKKSVTYTISIMDNATEKQSHYAREATVTSDEEAQAFAQSVRDELLNSTNSLVLDNLQYNNLQSAMVIMDYHNGHVKALIGGRGEKQGDLVFNRATQAERQPGSCFKVLAAYAPAIDLGILSPGSTIVDEPFSVGGWTPKNWWGSAFRGPSTVREGIRDSMNILAAKAIMMVGVDKAFDYMLNFGFTTLVSEPNEQGLSDRGPALALGGITTGVSVLELTAAYGAIANEGNYNKPVFYTTVYDHDGNMLLENKVEPKRVIKDTTAWLLTDMMEDVITGGGTGGLARFRNIKMPIAGKTGTTTDDKDLTFAGYTPYYVAGIWLGYDQPKRISYDRSYHLLLWSDVMEKIHANLEYKAFNAAPNGIITRSYCNVSGDIPVSGLCANDYYSGGTHSDYCAVEGTPSKTCDVHKLFRICKSTGKQAGPNCPSDTVIEVSLAIDPETGGIMNMPSELPEGKVTANISATCDHLIEAPEEVPPIGSEDTPPEGIGLPPELPPDITIPDGPITVPVIPPSMPETPDTGNPDIAIPDDAIDDSPIGSD